MTRRRREGQRWSIQIWAWNFVAMVSGSLEEPTAHFCLFELLGCYSPSICCSVLYKSTLPKTKVILSILQKVVVIIYHIKIKKCGRKTLQHYHFGCQEAGVPVDPSIKATSARNVASILQLAVSESQYLFLSIHSPLYHLSPDGRAHLGKRRQPASFKSPSRRNAMAESTYGAPGRSTNMRYHS